MGDCQTEPLRTHFDRRLRLEFHGIKVTSDAGLLAYRELDDALALTARAAAEPRDTRIGRNSRSGLTAPLRQSIDSRLAGYEDLNDADRLRLSTAMRTVVGGRARGSPPRPTRPRPSEPIPRLVTITPGEGPGITPMDGPYPANYPRDWTYIRSTRGMEPRRYAEDA